MDPNKQAKLLEIRNRQNRWLRERQAELDRESVVAELQQQHGGSSSSAGGPGGSSHGASRPVTRGSGASSGGPSVSASCTTLPPINGGGAAGSGPGAMGGGGGGGGGVLPATLGGVGGVKPEEVIDRLTERITDRLRGELKLELQRESQTLAAQQGALDTFLVRELESQNTCPVCYELMVPPDHAPMMLFPCGHSFCGACLEHHIDRNKKTQCPVCRKRIESRAPNYSLQQLIQQVAAKKERAAPRGPLSPGGGGGGGEEGLFGGEGGGGCGGGAALGTGGVPELGSNADRVRRQYERAATRMRVLRNELADTQSEAAALDGRMAAAAAVVGHLQEEEQQVLRRLAAVQAELELVREQLASQGGKVADLNRQAEAVAQRRELLQATLGPLEAEVEKLEVLMAGVMEMQ
ncbi:hypothetical protein HYH02_013230 [Chlamydomonas schloesseri]|uniref:RING-type domain-containing protein n=1 Tax=Chlamydomonas schloesseri TaxID=2026947 RepID=A0A835VZI4_9CHLO|nr:hypothetical protein HYH02_013230 [Chlamydomonas schloesseri]|eukprot:KAG2431653.1 hypothetical protein HYH02_013230 [Chlamydomonas schloesseri]